MASVGKESADRRVWLRSHAMLEKRLSSNLGRLQLTHGVAIAGEAGAAANKSTKLANKRMSWQGKAAHRSLRLGTLVLSKVITLHRHAGKLRLASIRRMWLVTGNQSIISRRFLRLLAFNGCLRWSGLYGSSLASLACTSGSHWHCSSSDVLVSRRVKSAERSIWCRWCHTNTSVVR